MNIFEFMNASPILAFFMIVILGPIWAHITWKIIRLVIESVLLVVLRVIRAFVVTFRGWPPEHLDVDGDANQHRPLHFNNFPAPGDESGEVVPFNKPKN